MLFLLAAAEYLHYKSPYITVTLPYITSILPKKNEKPRVLLKPTLQFGAHAVHCVTRADITQPHSFVASICTPVRYILYSHVEYPTDYHI